MNKKQILIWFIGCGWILSQPVMAQTMTDVVEQTIKTNPDIKTVESRQLAQADVVDQAKGGYYPKVDAAAGVGREWSENSNTEPGTRTLTRRESSLTLSQMLFDGYATKNEVEKNEAKLQAATYQTQDTTEKTALRAVGVYLDVLRQQELVALAKDNLVAHEKTYEQIKIRSESGVARKADMEQAIARLASSKANLAATMANLRESQINFKKVTGAEPVDPESAPEVLCDKFPATIDKAVGLAQSRHPEILASIAAYEASLAQERAASAPFYPRLDLNLETSRNDNLDGIDYKNNDAYAMLNLTYNLFRGGSDLARLKETGYQNEEALAQVEHVKRQVEESTRLSWSRLEDTKARLPDVKMHAEAASLTRDAYAKQFSIGQRTLLDLLDSENELYTARSELVNIKYDEQFATYRLLADMNMLLEDLGIKSNPVNSTP